MVMEHRPDLYRPSTGDALSTRRDDGQDRDISDKYATAAVYSSSADQIRACLVLALFT
jgi:hypothetical protein